MNNPNPFDMSHEEYVKSGAGQIATEPTGDNTPQQVEYLKRLVKFREDELRTEREKSKERIDILEREVKRYQAKSMERDETKRKIIQSLIRGIMYDYNIDKDEL